MGRARGKLCGAWQVFRVAQSVRRGARSLLALRDRLLGGRRCGRGWLRSRVRRAPDRAGAAVDVGDGRTLRREGAEERPA
eukprot:5866915-Prymnesium_polylepis.1